MAVNTNIRHQIQGFNFFKFDSLGQFLHNLIQVALFVGSIAALFYLTWGAVEFITSGGNQESAKSAKSKITSSTFGLVILAAVWIIWRLIIFFLGLSESAQGPLDFIIPSP